MFSITVQLHVLKRLVFQWRLHVLVIDLQTRHKTFEVAARAGIVVFF